VRITVFEGLALIERLVTVINKRMALGKIDFDARDLGEANKAKLDALREENLRDDPPPEAVGGTD